MTIFLTELAGRVQIIMASAPHPLTSRQLFRRLYPRKSLKTEAAKKLYADLKNRLSTMAANPCEYGIMHLAGLGYWHSNRVPFHVSSVPRWPTKKLSAQRFEQEVEFAFERHAKPLTTKHLLELLSARGLVMRGKLSRTAELERRMKNTGMYRKLPNGAWWHNTTGVTVVATRAA